MQDRFKFRAYVEDFCFDDEDGNEYKKSFMIYGVAVYGGCSVGTYVVDLIEQLEEQGFTDDEIEQVRDYYSENDDWFNFDADFVEQCTGLKDKNSKLIYEGDIIQTPSQRFFLKVDDFSVLAVVYPDFSDSFDWSEFVREIYYKERQGFIEVIGNIHENEELLK